MNKIITLICFVALVCFAGCTVYRAPVLPTGHYWQDPDKKGSKIGKVVLVELDNNSNYPQITKDVTQALFQELQLRQIFSIEVINKNDPRWKSLQVDLNMPFSKEQLARMNKTLNCNAVMVGTITRHIPYPHMTLGLKLRLIDLWDGKVIWATEHIWDAADKTTEYQIKNFFSDKKRAGTSPLGEQLLMVSALEFNKFVAYEVAKTIK